MTVNNNSNKVRIRGNGTTNEFPFNFPILRKDTADLLVYRIDLNQAGDYVVTKLILNVDYTVDVVKDLDNDIVGGKVKTNEIPTASQDILIYRSEALTQELDIRNNQRFPEEQVEKSFDKGMMISQRLFEELQRTLRISIFDGEDIDLEIDMSGGLEDTKVLMIKHI
jgi:hypothetical protein